MGTSFSGQLIQDFAQIRHRPLSLEKSRARACGKAGEYDFFPVRLEFDLIIHPDYQGDVVFYALLRHEFLPVVSIDVVPGDVNLLAILRKNLLEVLQGLLEGAMVHLQDFDLDGFSGHGRPGDRNEG